MVGVSWAVLPYLASLLPRLSKVDLTPAQALPPSIFSEWRAARTGALDGLHGRFSVQHSNAEDREATHLPLVDCGGLSRGTPTSTTTTMPQRWRPVWAISAPAPAGPHLAPRMAPPPTSRWPGSGALSP